MLLIHRYLLYFTKSGKGQPDNIAEKNALLALQRISTASSIDQILTIISASATNIDTNIGHQELDKDKIIRSAVKNTYSLSVQALRAAYRSYNLWSMLSFVLKYMNRIGLSLNSKFKDGNYVVKIENNMGNTWSLFIKDFVVMIFQKLAKIEPKVSINPNPTIVFSLPSSSSKSAEIVPMVSTKQGTVEEKIKNFASLTDAEKLCIVELYREFDRITQIVERRARED